VVVVVQRLTGLCAGSALMSLRELVTFIARSGRFVLLSRRLQFFVGAVVKHVKHISSPQLAYIVSRDLDDVFGISHWFFLTFFRLAASNSRIASARGVSVRHRVKTAWIFLLAATVASLLAINYAYGPHAQVQVYKAKAAIRAEDTRVLCSQAAAYTADIGEPPKSLDDLARTGYLKTIPKDFPTLKDCESFRSAIR
jgi:hypothetical protein